MKKAITKYIAIALVVISIISVGNIASAINIDTVAVSWHEIYQTAKYGPPLHYNTNYTYKDIRFFNGYTYTESTKNITSIWDQIGGIYGRIRHDRIYRTY